MGVLLADISWLTLILCVIGFLVAFWAFLYIMDWAQRAVNIDRPPLREFDRIVTTPVRHLQDGGAHMILHRGSGLLIQVSKAVLSDTSGDPTGRLRVLKKRAAEPRWPADSLLTRLTSYRMSLRGPMVRAFAVPSLPSPKAGEVLEDIDCGSSLTKMEEAVRRLILDDPDLAADPRFDTWCEKGGAFLHGTFDEDFSAHEDAEPDQPGAGPDGGK